MLNAIVEIRGQMATKTDLAKLEAKVEVRFDRVDSQLKDIEDRARGSDPGLMGRASC